MCRAGHAGTAVDPCQVFVCPWVLYGFGYPGLRIKLTPCVNPSEGHRWLPGPLGCLAMSYQTPLRWLQLEQNCYPNHWDQSHGHPKWPTVAWIEGRMPITERRVAVASRQPCFLRFSNPFSCSRRCHLTIENGLVSLSLGFGICHHCCRLPPLHNCLCQIACFENGVQRRGRGVGG